MADGMLASQGRKRKRGKRRPRQDAPAANAPALDHAHPIRLANGTVEIVQGADPAAPARTVRRAVRSAFYIVAYRRGEMAKPEYIAAERYAEMCDREAGATTGDGNGTTDQWSRTPPLTAMQAAAALRAAHEAVGPDATALLRCYVRDNLSVEAIAFARAKGQARADDGTPDERAKKLERRFQEGREVVKGRINAALTRLVEHWSLVRR